MHQSLARAITSYRLPPFVAVAAGNNISMSGASDSSFVPYYVHWNLEYGRIIIRMVAKMRDCLSEASLACID